MEKKVIEEITRVREIMGLKLITEGSFGPPKFIDELFQELAEKARTGDSALAGRFDNFLEKLKNAGKNVGDLNDYAFGASRFGRDITDDLGNQLDDVYKFVDDLLEDVANGPTWKNYLIDALKTSSDDVFQSMGKQLEIAKKTLKYMAGYDDVAHDEAVEILENMRDLINASTLDDELKPILMARYGLDNIPKRKIVPDVTDVVDDAVEDIVDSPEVRDEAGELLDPKKWPQVSGLSADEIKSIGKKIDSKIRTFFSNWFTSSDAKIKEMAQILKTLREQGNLITAQERNNLEKRFGQLIDSFWLENRKLFSNINTWYEQISVNDRELASIINKLKGKGQYGKSAVGLIESDPQFSAWWYAIKDALANAFAGEILIVSKMVKKIQDSQIYKNLFGEAADKTKEAAGGGFFPWLISGSRKGFPWSTNKNYKKIIEDGALPLARKTYAMELVFRTAKWKVIFAALATLRNAIAFAFNKTESTDCKNTIQKLKDGIDADKKLMEKFKVEDKYNIPFEPVIQGYITTPEGNQVASNVPYQIADGTIIVIPESCKTGSKWKLWANDFAEGDEGRDRFKEEFVENLFDVTFGDQLTDFIPGKVDDLIYFTWYEGMEIWGTDKTWEEMASKIDEELVFVQSKIEEGTQKLDEAIDEKKEKIPTKEEMEANLDSLNIKKPEIPKVESTTSVVPGSASNEVKEDFKKYINNDQYFSDWYIEIKDYGDGKIKVFYANKGKYAYDESKGKKPFYDILRKEGNIWVLDGTGEKY